MFTLIVNGKEFTYDSYSQFCNDPKCWDEVVEGSGWDVVAGDWYWHYMMLSLHEAVTKVETDRTFYEWHGIYKPKTIPPIGFKITE